MFSKAGGKIRACPRQSALEVAHKTSLLLYKKAGICKVGNAALCLLGPFRNIKTLLAINASLKVT